MKKALSRAAVILFWLAVWQIAANRVDNRILLTGPAEVCMRIMKELGSMEFYASAAGSLARIMAGFLLGMISGAAIGACAFFCRVIRRLLEPVILAMKSVPVAAFVILVLIWSGSENLAVPISFFVVFPYFYVQTMTGLAETDEMKLAFARVCGMRGLNRILYLYRPALAPYLLGAARITIGMSFKSGIAAEVIGIPESAIGTRLYMSKVYLDTAGVLAWTVVIVLLSFLCEKVILYLLGALLRLPVPPLSGRGKSSVRANAEKKGQMIVIPAMSKTYQGKKVVRMPELSMKAGTRLALVGESGSGKTTWLKMLMGLTEPDNEKEKSDGAENGALRESPQISPVFQEDCLFPEQTAMDNLRMVCAEENKERIRECLELLLPAGTADQPAAELSGGMQRRTAVARAALAGGGMLVLDEPFSGLDMENRKRLATFVLKQQGDRVLIFTAHDEAEAALLFPDKTIRLPRA
jgi:NitT/TauT family transport system permease protein